MQHAPFKPKKAAESSKQLSNSNITSEVKDMMNKISKLEREHNEADVKVLSDLVAEDLKKDISRLSLQELNEYKNGLTELLKKIEKSSAK